MRTKDVAAFGTALMMLVYAFASAAEAEKTHETVFLSKEDGSVRAKSMRTDETLFHNPMAKDVIEWALGQARITVLRDGRYEVVRTVVVPESDTALVIGPDAELAAGPEAELTALTEGHARFSTLIHNQRRDNVKIINLGTLDAGGKTIEKGQGTDVRGKNGWPSCVTFDGRDGGTCGIEGGLIFSPGAVENCHDAFWIVDTANAHIPLIYRKSGGNVPFAMEGCEDCRVGFIAGLQGDKSFENETLDFNSFNRNIKVNTLLGTGPVRDEILDINNSPGCTIKKVIGYGSTRKINLVSRNLGGPGGRRLTQKAYIDHSDGTVVHEKEVKDKKVVKWKKEVETPDFPDSLPVLKVKTNLTAVLEDGSEEEIFSENYRFNLDENR